MNHALHQRSIGGERYRLHSDLGKNKLPSSHRRLTIFLLHFLATHMSSLVKSFAHVSAGLLVFLRLSCLELFIYSGEDSFVTCVICQSFLPA